MKATYSKSEVMKAAWAMFRATNHVSFATCLKVSWAKARTGAEQCLVLSGKVWPIVSQGQAFFLQGLKQSNMTLVAKFLDVCLNGSDHAPDRLMKRYEQLYNDHM